MACDQDAQIADSALMIENAIAGYSSYMITGHIFVTGFNKQQKIFDLLIATTNNKFYFEITATNKFRIGGRSVTGDSLQYQESTETVPFMKWLEFSMTLDLANNETRFRTINGEEYTMTGTMTFAKLVLATGAGNASYIARFWTV